MLDSSHTFKLFNEIPDLDHTTSCLLSHQRRHATHYRINKLGRLVYRYHLILHNPKLDFLTPNVT